MTIADKPHGRTRYNAGCRCGTCKAANREHSRRRRNKHLTAVPPGDQLHQTEFVDGRVTAAVRAELAQTTAAQERPGLYAIAVRLAQLMDRDDCVAQHSAAAHRLTGILGTLSKCSIRRGRLSVIRGMTASDPAGSRSSDVSDPADPARS